MKAQNLTICVPYKGCDKNCPYCVSKMTGYVKTDLSLMRRNVHKVLTVARASGITSVLLTGKGEPALNLEGVMWLLEKFHEYPIEMQTNGITLAGYAAVNDKLMPELRENGLDVVAFSVGKLERIEWFAPFFKQLRKQGFVIRVTLNVTKRIPLVIRFKDILKLCKAAKVHQFSLRQITVPNNSKPGKVAKEAKKWIAKNVSEKQYRALVDEIRECKGHSIRQLPYGVEVFDIGGVAVTWFDYCVQDRHGEDDVRSLILKEDGHLYSAWNSAASILF